jgi:hypothetical protein
MRYIKASTQCRVQILHKLNAETPSYLPHWEDRNWHPSEYEGPGKAKNPFSCNSHQRSTLQAKPQTSTWRLAWSFDIWDCMS